MLAYKCVHLCRPSIWIRESRIQHPPTRQRPHCLVNIVLQLKAKQIIPTTNFSVWYDQEHDVVLTLIRRCSDVNNAVTTFKRLRVLAEQTVAGQVTWSVLPYKLCVLVNIDKENFYDDKENYWKKARKKKQKNNEKSKHGFQIILHPTHIHTIVEVLSELCPCLSL